MPEVEDEDGGVPGGRDARAAAWGTPGDLELFRRRTRVPRAFADLELRDMEGFGGKGPYGLMLSEVQRLTLDAAAQTVPGEREPTFLARPLNLLLFGGFGSGKTRIACWVLRELYRAVYPTHFPDRYGLFLRASRAVETRFSRGFLRGEEDGEDEGADLRRRAETSAVLVLDDVSRLPGYRGEGIYLEQLVEHRWGEGLSTILTLNGKVEALEERFRDLLRYHRCVNVPGGSRR